MKKKLATLLLAVLLFYLRGYAGAIELETRLKVYEAEESVIWINKRAGMANVIEPSLTTEGDGGRVLGTLSEIPPSASLIRAYLPEVRNQENNTCSCWSLGYYCMGYQYREARGIESRGNMNNLSVFYSYNQIDDGTDRGVAGLKLEAVFRGNGNIIMAEYPGEDYVAGVASINMQIRGMLNRIREWERVVSSGENPPSSPVTRMKEVIALGLPVSGVIPVDMEPSLRNLYGTPSNYVYDSVMGERDDSLSHQVTFVAYQDDSSLPGGGAFKIRNSWGKNWGCGGEMWLSYRFIREYAKDIFVFSLVDADYSPTAYLLFRIVAPRVPSLSLEAIEGVTVNPRVTVKVDDVKVWDSVYTNIGKRNDREIYDQVVDLSDFIKTGAEKISLYFKPWFLYDDKSVLDSIVFPVNTRYRFLMAELNVGGRCFYFDDLMDQTFEIPHPLDSSKSLYASGVSLVPVDEDPAVDPAHIIDIPDPVYVNLDKPSSPQASEEEGFGAGCNSGLSVSVSFMVIPLLLLFIVGKVR